MHERDIQRIDKMVTTRPRETLHQIILLVPLKQSVDVLYNVLFILWGFVVICQQGYHYWHQSIDYCISPEPENIALELLKTGTISPGPISAVSTLVFSTKFCIHLELAIGTNKRMKFVCLTMFSGSLLRQDNTALRPFCTGYIFSNSRKTALTSEKALALELTRFKPHWTCRRHVTDLTKFLVPTPSKYNSETYLDWYNNTTTSLRRRYHVSTVIHAKEEAIYYQVTASNFSSPRFI